ncbi:MAG: hypothetical protein AB1742_04280 [bacterium]
MRCDLIPKPECRATAVGSLPHENPATALDSLLARFADIPFWPQLPKRSYLEGMIPQYSEGIPGAVVDAEAEKTWVKNDESLIEHMERFYETYMAQHLEPFSISPEYAAGLHEFIRRMRESPKDRFAVKGHTTGPVTWGLTAPGADGRACYYDVQFRDVLVKSLERKARWQTAALKMLCPTVIIFIDEPYLQSIGASFVSLDEDTVARNLDEVIDGIHDAGAAAGIHCCGNTNWALLARTKTDVINFDAYDYAQSLSLYPREVGGFLERGGILAWGIVPSSNSVRGENADSLITLLREGFRFLTRKGVKETLLFESCLLTPSCGAGSLDAPLSEKMLSLTAEISKILRGGNTLPNSSGGNERIEKDE